MYMIGHHTPCQQTIALSIPMQQGVLDDIRNGRLFQPACPVAGVEKRFDSVVFLRFISGLLPQTIQHIGGKGIRQPESNGLEQARGIAVRQITTAMPVFMRAGCPRSNRIASVWTASVWTASVWTASVWTASVSLAILEARRPRLRELDLRFAVGADDGWFCHGQASLILVLIAGVAQQAAGVTLIQLQLGR